MGNAHKPVVYLYDHLDLLEEAEDYCKVPADEDFISNLRKLYKNEGKTAKISKRQFKKLDRLAREARKYGR